jgi:hypothetical protein
LVGNSWADNPNGKAIEQFTDCDHLLADLEHRMTDDAQASRHRRLISQLIPHLKFLERWFPFLTVSISLPTEAERSAIIWAILYLGIKV